jgi:hypothetical protein
VSGEFLAAGDLTLNKKEVVGPSDSYDLGIKGVSAATVVIRYSYEGGAPEEYRQQLDSSGRARYAIGPETKKGTYRFLAYRRAEQSTWRHVDASIRVK